MANSPLFALMARMNEPVHGSEIFLFSVFIVVICFVAEYVRRLGED